MRDKVHVSLDLATTSGWAAGVPFGAPETGAWKIGAGPDGRPLLRGERYTALRARMVAMFSRFEPAVCFIEEPLPPRVLVDIGATHETAMILPGFVAVAEMMCDLYGVRSILVERRLALLHFTGQDRYKEKDGAKKACVKRCQQLKYPIDGYDAADAAAQWDYGCARLYAGAYAMIRSQLPPTVKGYDDARLPNARGFARRRRPQRKASPGLFDHSSD